MVKPRVSGASKAAPRSSIRTTSTTVRVAGSSKAAIEILDSDEEPEPILLESDDEAVIIPNKSPLLTKATKGQPIAKKRRSLNAQTSSISTSDTGPTASTASSSKLPDPSNAYTKPHSSTLPKSSHKEFPKASNASPFSWKSDVYRDSTEAPNATPDAREDARPSTSTVKPVLDPTMSAPNLNSPLKEKGKDKNMSQLSAQKRKQVESGDGSERATKKPRNEEPIRRGPPIGAPRNKQAAPSNCVLPGKPRNIDFTRLPAGSRPTVFKAPAVSPTLSGVNALGSTTAGALWADTNAHVTREAEAGAAQATARSQSPMRVVTAPKPAAPSTLQGALEQSVSLPRTNTQIEDGGSADLLEVPDESGMAIDEESKVSPMDNADMPGEVRMDEPSSRVEMTPNFVLKVTDHHPVVAPPTTTSSSPHRPPSKLPTPPPAFTSTIAEVNVLGSTSTPQSTRPIPTVLPSPVKSSEEEIPRVEASRSSTTPNPISAPVTIPRSTLMTASPKAKLPGSAPIIDHDNSSKSLGSPLPEAKSSATFSNSSLITGGLGIGGALQGMVDAHVTQVTGPLLAKISFLEGRIRQRDEDIERFTQTREEAQKTAGSLNDTVAALTKEVQQLKTLTAGQQQELSEARATQARLVKDRCGMGKLLEGLQSDFDTAKEEKDQLTEQNRELQSTIDSKANMLSELQKTVDELNTEKQALNLSLDESKASKARAERVNLQLITDTLSMRQQLETSTKAKVDLHASLVEAYTARDTLAKENAELSGAIKPALESALAVIRTRDEQLAQSRRSYNQLQEAFETAFRSYVQIAYERGCYAIVLKDAIEWINVLQPDGIFEAGDVLKRAHEIRAGELMRRRAPDAVAESDTPVDDLCRARTGEISPSGLASPGILQYPAEPVAAAETVEVGDSTTEQLALADTRDMRIAEREMLDFPSNAIQDVSSMPDSIQDEDIAHPITSEIESFGVEINDKSEAEVDELASDDFESIRHSPAPASPHDNVEANRLDNPTPTMILAHSTSTLEDDSEAFSSGKVRAALRTKHLGTFSLKRKGKKFVCFFCKLDNIYKKRVDKAFVKHDFKRRWEHQNDIFQHLANEHADKIGSILFDEVQSWRDFNNANKKQLLRHAASGVLGVGDEPDSE